MQDQLTTAPAPEAEPVTVYFSFGHGQHDPDTGEHLLGKYVTIVGPSYAACRTAMFASRYGDRWAFDYIAGEPAATEWIPRWIEHERIVLPLDASTETVADILAELGETADAVADQLRAKGIKGTRNDECDCPIARLLGTLPGIETVEVSNAAVAVYSTGETGLLPHGVELPIAVSEFVWLFDQGVFLDLVELPAVA